MKAKTGVSAGDPAVLWHLYILKCGDGSYYTGVTTDIERRVREHQEGKASRYTRTHLPVELIHKETCGSRPLALSRECAVKSLSREKKEDLVAGGAKPKYRKAARTAHRRKR
ncbi:MAG: GIY-YIG nuclease family protein [Acidobacteriota bacterium]|nr:GIY-YIG nuclease family protein [Acidobacteriota bacterium]